MKISTTIVVFFLLMLMKSSTSTDHWFSFSPNQFPAFRAPLLTLTSSINNQSNVVNLSFTFVAYQESIVVDIILENSTANKNEEKSIVRLNVSRANFVHNKFHEVIFIAVRQGSRLESYVDCKLIDSYVHSIDFNNDSDVVFQISQIADYVEHFQIDSKNDSARENFFEKYSCQSPVSNGTLGETTIDASVIGKMHHIINQMQQKSKTLNDRFSSSLDSMTIVYNPLLDNTDGKDVGIRTILNIPALKFRIQYDSNEALFDIQLNDRNQSRWFLYADPSIYRISTAGNTPVIFLHLTPTTSTSFVNCELTDEEFLLDSSMIRKAIRAMKNASQTIFNRQSTMIFFNQSIDQIATNLYCSSLDRQRRGSLPNQLVMKKFVTALDSLVKILDNPADLLRREESIPKARISAIEIPVIDGYGNLKGPSLDEKMNIAVSSTTGNLFVEYNQLCLTNDDCTENSSSMICQSKRCVCPQRYFWSSTLRRCLFCHDLLIGTRCFRLSNHKSSWYESNDYCQRDSGIGDSQEYTMKLTSNLNRTDFQSLKQTFSQESHHEDMNYIYCIGATSYSDTKTLHQLNARLRRQIPATIFRWYDNGQIAPINLDQIWCSPMSSTMLKTEDQQKLCVSITSCGLYADDCQRNYRFICEAI